MKRKAGFARDQEVNFHNFFDASDDLIFVLDDKGIIIQINATVVRRLGYSAKELIGQSVLMVYSGARGSATGRIVERMLAGEEECCPVSLITKSGQLISTEIRITSGSWKGKTAFWGIFKDVSALKVMDLADISELKQAVNRLMAQNQELERRGRQKTVDLSVANQKLRTQFKNLMQAKEKQQRSIEIQTVLREIAEATMRTSSLKEFLMTVHQLVRKVLPTNNFYISMHDPINNRILFPYCVSETNLVEGQRPVAKGLTEYLLRQEKVVFLTPVDLVRLVENGEVSSDMAPRMSWLGMPLTDAWGKTCGAMVMCWLSENQAVQENYIRLLEIIAAQVSVAIIRVRAEEALRESEALFTMGPAVKLIIDPHDGNIVNANGIALDFYGYSAHEIKAMNINDINVDPAKGATKIPIKTMQEGVERPNFRHRVKDGSLKDVEVYSGLITIGGKTLLQSTIIDVSSREKMERELQKSSERLELVIEASGAGIWDWNMKSGAMFLDRQWKSIIGYAEHEFEDEFSEWSDRIHPEDSRRMLQAVAEAQKDKTGKYEVEYRLRHKDGSYRWVKTIGKITYDEKGEPERLTGSNIDVTENRKLMTLHLENENRLKDFAQAVPDVSFVIDEAGKVIEAFGSDETMFPAPKTHIQGHTISEVFSGEMAKNLMEDIKRTIEKKSTMRVEYVADVAKGQLFLVGRLSPMRFILEGKNLVAAVFQDFTERWKAESMLQASYQMRRKSDFLNDLILGSRALDKETMEFAAKIGLDFSRPLFCCIVSCEQSSVSGNKSNGSIFDVPARKDEIMEAIDDGTNRIIWDCRDVIGVIYMLEELDTVDRKCCIKAAEFLQANISENNPGIDVMIGIGDVGLGGDGLRNSFQQAWSTMTAIRSRAGKTGSISHYRDLGILQLLARKIDNDSAKDFIRVTIGKILDYDRDKGTEYLQTLDVILSHESLKEAAQLLFVHPNTVLYRRQRIEKLLNISLDDIEAKVAVIAAMKLYKLNH